MESMTTTTTTTVPPPDPPAHGSPVHGKLSFWAGVIAAPLLWGMYLQFTYMLVPWVCVSKRTWVLHLTTTAFLALIGVGGYLSWYDWHHSPGEHSGAGSDSPDVSLGRHRFVGMLGMMSSALFFLVVLATGLASFFHDPCAD